jgi:hypothetical protein
MGIHKHCCRDAWPTNGLQTSQQSTQNCLREDDCHPCQFTPGIWKYVWNPVTFTLVVDNFGVKYRWEQCKSFSEHLKSTLQDHRRLVGRKYVGIYLDWHYKIKTLDTCVPNLIQKTLHKFQHPMPTKPPCPSKSNPNQFWTKQLTGHSKRW